MDAPLVTQNDLVGSLLAEVVVADSEGGGVKALCGAAQEWRHLLDGMATFIQHLLETRIGHLLETFIGMERHFLDERMSAFVIQHFNTSDPRGLGAVKHEGLVYASAQADSGLM